MTFDHDPLLICDLTQSYSPHGGGGISTYLREKRHHVLARTDHRLLQIVPGAEDRIVDSGQHIWVEIGSEPVRGSPNYRFITRTKAVHEVLRRFRPNLIESLCPWVLPWTAINYRKANPQTALVAGYRTDFPNAHVYRVARELFGMTLARFARWLSLGYAEITYREFDHVYTLGEEARAMLNRRGITRIDVLPLGVDTQLFDPSRRDHEFRSRLQFESARQGPRAGMEGPLLVYAGRIDNEKRAGQLIAMMRHLPEDFGARLIMVGDGKLRERLAAEASDLPVAFRGFVQDRNELAVALASSDIYVSAMADETFGISVIESQASGLPVVGVASGAMPERVPPGLGLLGPVDDPAAMARNVMQVWQGDPRAMGRCARAHVANRYSWERTFQQLFGEVYPLALAHARGRMQAPRRQRSGTPDLVREAG